MCTNLLEIDKEIINKYREEHELPAPCDFELGRIDHVLVEKLMPLIKLEFDIKAVESTRVDGFNAKGVSASLLEARLQEVFGTSHIKVEHRVVEHGYIENSDNKPVKEDDDSDESEDSIDENDSQEASPTKPKKGLHYYKVYVVVKIGNWTFYSDNNGKPDTNFVTYYQVEGIGYGRAINVGTAEKNALANGKKEAFRNMGMLRYLYIEEDNKKPIAGDQTTIELMENPNMPSSGTLFLKCKAKDLQNDKEVVAIIYRENKYNAEGHKKMIDMLTEHKTGLVKGKKMNINYKRSSYLNEEQYQILSIISKQ